MAPACTAVLLCMCGLHVWFVVCMCGVHMHTIRAPATSHFFLFVFLVVSATSPSAMQSLHRKNGVCFITENQPTAHRPRSACDQPAASAAQRIAHHAQPPRMQPARRVCGGGEVV
jgi:hypothetical protein